MDITHNTYVNTLESGPQEPSVLNSETFYLISSPLEKNIKKKILVPSLVIRISPCLEMFCFMLTYCQ